MQSLMDIGQANPYEQVGRQVGLRIWVAIAGAQGGILMRKSGFLRNDKIIKIKKILYVFLGISACFLVVHAFKWLITDELPGEPAIPQVVQYLHDLESPDSPEITTKEGTPVVLADAIPLQERLEFKVRNRIIFSFTNDLNIMITNHTDDEMGFSPELDALEIFENNSWTYVPIVRSTRLGAYALGMRANCDMVVSYPLYCYDLKKGRYRAIIGYRTAVYFIVQSVEFKVVGIF